MVFVKHFIAVMGLACLSACTSASHIPPPWELPGAAAGSVIENARYKARRGKVKDFIAENYEILAQDIRAGGGPSFEQAMTLASVPPEKRSDLFNAIQQTPALYFEGPMDERIENLTVALMVHGD